MPSSVVVVKNLSKEYLLSETQTHYQTLTSSLNAFFKNPFRREKKKVFSALNNVSFSLEQGERLAVMGRNGAGKSTLLKILSKVTTPTSGHFHLKGKVSSLLEVGTGFHLELTGRENIFLSGSILGMKRKEIIKKFDEIVAFAEVEPFLNVPVKHYSSGMMTRLGFSVGAHLDPDLMIIDEVLAVGDALFQQKCFSKMKSLANLGKAFLFVSHNESFLSTFCTKGLVLERGEVVFLGELSEALKRYRQLRSDLKSEWHDVLELEGVTFRAFSFEEEKALIVYDYKEFDPDLFFEVALFDMNSSLVGRSNILPKVGEGQRMVLPLPVKNLMGGQYFLHLNAHKHNRKTLMKDPLVLKVVISKPLEVSHFETGGASVGISLCPEVFYS